MVRCTGPPRWMGVVPLIGGATLGCQASTGAAPLKIYSMEAFRPNESHLQEYFENKVKFEYFNDYSEMPNSNGTLNLDLVSSVLPCAGLSTLNRTNRGQNAEQNMHMLKAAQYVLICNLSFILVKMLLVSSPQKIC